MNSRDQDDRTWKALADDTRRSILDVLSKRPHNTGELVELFPRLSRTGVMKHLDVLEAGRLITVRREGRVRWNELNPMPIQRIYDRWVSNHIRGVASAMSRFKDHVESRETEESARGPRRKTSKRRTK
jgi:DNA-binding transcriptional ArsR family regulator